MAPIAFPIQFASGGVIDLSGPYRAYQSAAVGRVVSQRRALLQSFGADLGSVR
jgi:hypothetical protein